jgi:RING-like zinc finger/PA domain
MRPPRLFLLVFCFIAFPIFLTFLSLLSAHPSHADALTTNYRSSPSRLRAAFSFNSPTSLFPPSAVISLTNDNSTFFLARPASFGPLLPDDGLSGQLWVGRGFAAGSKGELGCSDVPGWNEGDQKHSDEQSVKIKAQRKKVVDAKGIHPTRDPKAAGKNLQDLSSRSTFDTEDVHADAETLSSEDDGTDDYLHHPLLDSNPAEATKPGQPAEHEGINDKKKPTHADIQSLQESAEIAGKVVLLSRGGCGFLEKVKWAQRRGAVAIIVGDDEPGRPLLIMYARGDTSNVTIPALFTSYTTAHLLSSLVPAETREDLSQPVSKEQAEIETSGKKSKDKSKPDGPTFTSSKGLPTSTSTPRPSIIPAANLRSSVTNRRIRRRNWLSSLLSAFGIGVDSGYPWHIGEDSRRPPSSGNIDWVLLEDWDENDLTHSPVKSSLSGTTATATAKPPYTKSKSSQSHQSTSDEFVIGVQDWRDPDLVVSDTKGSSDAGSKNGKPGKDAGAAASKSPAAATGVFKGGSITPGSGEYEDSRIGHTNGHDKVPKLPGAQNLDTKAPQPVAGGDGWFEYFRWGSHGETETSESDRLAQGETLPEESSHVDKEGDEEHEGLWVTLTPTTVSTNPFFDTLLVLVVSPLVTLTVVYALLLLRSRIRRRRWRAPKSVVERLPVRTYHTISNSSSTTSLQIASPSSSSPTSPLLQSANQTITSRSRPRSQTTSDAAPGIPSSTECSSASSASSSPAKGGAVSGSVARKRYTGRQVECVVCLEEYVDGQSRVMSLPCGHEFHADCM